MSAEKMIKTEAKKMLVGKWPAALVAVFVLMFLPMISGLIVIAAYGVLGESELVSVFSEEPIKAVLFAVLNLAAVAALVLLSPVYNGFARLYSSAASGKDADISDVFYFFENNRRYKNAVVFMSGLLVKTLGILLVCEAAAIVAAVMSGDSETIKKVAVALAIVGLVPAFLWLHRFAFSMMLFSYYDYDPVSAAKTGAEIARGGTGRLMMLSVKYAPWMLSTFFVVPFLYVFPYMTCAYFVSAKYLIGDYLQKKVSEKLTPDNTPENLSNESVNEEKPINEAENNMDISSADDNEEVKDTAVNSVSLEKSAAEE